MKLSAKILDKIDSKNVTVPSAELIQLPEKVLQFGTGMLLRGLPDYFIDKANREGIFGGRIVVVKSTSKGDASLFESQDGLYTLCVRGLENRKPVENNLINSSISRVLNASEEWPLILDCARNPDLQIIISNTTEAGIKLVENDDIRKQPPISFPGKLLSFLHERFKVFGGSNESGLVIIPAELIPGNGDRLKEIVLELAKLNELELEFIDWIKRDNHFCNSLVDRIVTGTPSQEVKAEIELQLGYEDDLLTVCEVYKLWAIEGDENIKKILSFSLADEGMIIASDITLFRELKLRLLNAVHTMSCGVAFLAGIELVREGMEDKLMADYISGLMKEEIGGAMPYTIEPEVISDYCDKVLDRFRNPHINHLWKNITLNYSDKIRLRCVPVLNVFYQQFNRVPELMALGFAAYIYFMKPVKQLDDSFYGKANNEFYAIDDEEAGKFHVLWQTLSAGQIVEEVLKNVDLWVNDLTLLPGFSDFVKEKLESIINIGMRNTLENVIKNKMYV